MMDLSRLEEILGYKFNNKELLSQALIHSSYANEVYGDSLRDNERLEFLGDAVLDMVISKILYSSEHRKEEGDLTKLRASIVCEKSLAKISRRYGLNQFLVFGRGEQLGGGMERDSIIADGVEAIIGAVYDDGGFEQASELIKRFFAEAIAEAKAGKTARDSKTELQERLQTSGPCLIEYKEIREFGPDHDKSFVFAVYANGDKLGEGCGKSKKLAQAAAAEEALKGL